MFREMPRSSSVILAVISGGSLSSSVSDKYGILPQPLRHLADLAEIRIPRLFSPTSTEDGG
jgi:hypothetical protein